MKKHYYPLLVLLLGTMTLTAFAQTAAKQEYVSQRIANAISNGKFYMELSGVVDPNQYLEEGDKPMSNVVTTLRLAHRNGATMNRFNTDMSTALNHVNLSINGYNYTLNETQKTYTVQPLEESEANQNSFGKLTFMRQGTCQLNGSKYHYDVWRTASGHKLTFYYNSKNVTAVDFGMEGMGIMNLLSFDTRIPKDMYFCLTPEWKRTNAAASGMTGIDTDAMMQQALSKVNPDELPAGIDLKALMGGKVDTKKLIQQHVKEEDLPEGMNMNDLMGMVGGTDISAAMKNLTPEQKKMMQQQGIDLSQMEAMNKEMEREKKKAEVANRQAAQFSANAPEPPVCSTPWTDNSASVQLAAGNDMGAITLTAQTNSPRTDYVYMSDFDNAPKPVIHRTDLNVTDEGIWLAFDDLSKQIEGKSNEEAHQHIQQVNSGMLSAMEAGYITGQMVEYAVATCMIDPQPLHYNNTGMLFVKVEDTERALLYFEKASEMDPENPAILTNIGECFLDKKDYAAARRYVDKALASHPTFGPALQLHTTLLLQEGKQDEAISALFNCAAYYFSDITASQFFSLVMQIQAETAKAAAMNDPYVEPFLKKVFSPKNQELLAKATKAGFNSNGQDKPENAKSFPFTYAPAAIETTHASLAKMHDGFMTTIEQLSDYGNEINHRENLHLDLYWSMGMTNISGTMKSTENTINEVPQIGGKADFATQALETINQGYELINQSFYKDKAVSMMDARQFWCLMMWKTYYERYIIWADGYTTTTRPGYGKVLGDCPDTYRNYHRVIYKNIVSDSIARANHDKCMKSCAKSATTEKALLICTLDCERNLFKWLTASKIANHTALKQHYETSMQPLMEEYWLRMNAMTAYCDNLDMQEYFLTNAMYFINNYWTTGLQQAAQDGATIAAHRDIINKMAQAVGERIQQIEQEEAEKREALKKKDAVLKNYGEKSSPDFGMGIPTPIGRVSFMHSDGETTFSFESAASGKTYSRNMTTGKTTTMTTYKTIADERREKPSLIEQVGKWAHEKGNKNIVDMVGRTMVKEAKLDRFFPYSQESSKQQARTVDSQGNVTDTYNVQKISHGFNIGGISATATQTQIRSGASLQTKNHVTFGFKYFDITVGK